MDNENGDFENFFNFLNSNSTTDPSYLVSDTVKICPKTNVNLFGAKFIPVLYYVIFLLSYLGNGLVLFIIYNFEKLNTVTNIFLLNLVFSNILFASSLPFWATYHSSEWIFGMVLCKFVSSVYFIGFYSSILFLSLMTFDRYLAVVHAVAAAKSRKKVYAIITSMVVWFVSIAASIKDLVLRNILAHPQYGVICEETGFPEDTMNTWRLISYYQQFLIFFLLPLLMVMYCYISIVVRIMSTRMKEKCRAIKLIFVIMFMFFTCWTPFNIVILLRAVQISNWNSNRETDCTQAEALDYAFYVTRNFAYLYCCISPVFYTFVGKKFQSYFKRLLGKNMPCLNRHGHLSSQSSRTTSHRTSNTTYYY